LSQEKLSFTIPGSINVGPNVSDEKEMKKYVLLLVSAGGNQDQENVIRERVMGILEGEMRQVAASMTIEEIYNNRKQFQARIAEYVSSSLAKFGLVLYNAAIKELQDNGGYFTIMGERASQAAASVAKVSVAESKMLSDIGATDRNCRAQRETVRLKTEGIIYENQRQQSIVQSKAELEVKNAKFKADSKVAEIEGHKKAEVRDQELKKELESKRVTVELQRMRAENLTKATVDGEKIMKMAEAAAYETKKKAEAKLFEMQKIAEGKLFQAEKEAEGIQKMYMAQAEGLNELISSFNDEEAALQYILMDKNIYKMLATQNALSIQGMKPTINVWSTDGEEAGSVTGLIKSLPPMLTAIKNQTGIDPPKWLASMPEGSE
jgi:flotillin